MKNFLWEFGRLRIWHWKYWYEPMPLFEIIDSPACFGVGIKNITITISKN